jgi:hypothetical protein
MNRAADRVHGVQFSPDTNDTKSMAGDIASIPKGGMVTLSIMGDRYDRFAATEPRRSHPSL